MSGNAGNNNNGEGVSYYVWEGKNFRLVKFVSANKTPEPLEPLKAGSDCRVGGVDYDDTLNMRPAAGDLKTLVVKIPHNGTDIKVEEKEVKVGKSTWVPVSWKGNKGWVNRKFIIQDGP